MRRITIFFACLLTGSLGYGADRVYPTPGQLFTADCPVAYTGLDNNVLGDSWADCYNNVGDPYGTMANRAASWGFSGVRIDSRKVYFFNVPADGDWVLRGKFKWIAASNIYGIGGGLTIVGYRIEVFSKDLWEQNDLAGSSLIALPIPTFNLESLKLFMDAKSIVDMLVKYNSILTNDFKVRSFELPRTWTNYNMPPPPPPLHLSKGMQTYGIVSLFALTSAVGGITAQTSAAAQVMEIYLECVSNGGVCLPAGCFESGSKVLTPQGKKNIEKLSIGDLVYSFDDSAGRLAPQRVKNVIHKNAEELLEASFTGGLVLRVTPRHRFYNPRLKEYRAIGEYKVGEKVLWADAAHSNEISPVGVPMTARYPLDNPALKAGGSVLGAGEGAALKELTLIGVKELPKGNYSVHNLTIDGAFHNYLVEGVVVHNTKKQ